MQKLRLILVLLTLSGSGLAQQIEIGGLLLDNTFSRFGRDFYYQFSQLWRDIPQTEGLNVVIREKVVPRAGTYLTLHMNNQLVYQTYMGRRQERMDLKLEQAVLALIDAMAKARLQVDSKDMALNGY